MLCNRNHCFGLVGIINPCCEAVRIECCGKVLAHLGDDLGPFLIGCCVGVGVGCLFCRRYCDVLSVMVLTSSRAAFSEATALL
jgi:hypothetical protein